MPFCHASVKCFVLSWPVPNNHKLVGGDSFPALWDVGRYDKWCLGVCSTCGWLRPRGGWASLPLVVKGPVVCGPLNKQRCYFQRHPKKVAQCWRWTLSPKHLIEKDSGRFPAQTLWPFSHCLSKTTWTPATFSFRNANIWLRFCFKSWKNKFLKCFCRNAYSGNLC